MKKMMKYIKDSFHSNRGFIYSPSLVVFIMIISAISGFSICIKYKLEILDNINILSEKILLEARIINEFKCLLYDDNLNDYLVDDIYVEITNEGEEYNLFYNGNHIKLNLDGFEIISIEYS